MSFNNLFNFLQNLQNNNSKEWMDNHRKEYQLARDFYIKWLDTLNSKLAEIDPHYFNTPGKKAINRINNNLMFHPEKPTYKDHFGAGLDQVTKQGDFYIQIGINESFIGGGYWHPSAKILKSIREAIDYNGDELVNIITKPSFKKMFGDLVVDDLLKTAPRGFTQDHKHIDLLRRKSFAVVRNFTKTQITAANFEQEVIATYKELLPFRRYLNKAVTV